MTCKILGVSGSPVKKGNVENFLSRAWDGLPEEGMEREVVHLSRLKIRGCIHCNFCLTRQTPGKYCSLKDDAQAVFEKAEAADILVLASPVYFMRSSAYMAALIDRFRVFVFGNLSGGKMKNKIGVSMAVSWLRQGGLETTHLTHILAFLTLEMIPASVHKGVSPLGASAYASLNGSGAFDPSVTLGIENDEAGLQSARLIMRRALELAKLMSP
ncbi:MAG: flavodoxin family protein [Deltaproteobacteria bacterium]|nr:flavodoxin family protein [Deltaproteobacteria bacterium]